MNLESEYTLFKMTFVSDPVQRNKNYIEFWTDFINNE